MPVFSQAITMILLTNDDGFQSEGLLALKNAVQFALPQETIVTVAPSSQQSQIGHQVTTETPIKVDQHHENMFAVAGTPADCVRVALFGLSIKPDLILSGINHGGNLGHDIPISGTVAAVREGAYHGIPGIAFSQYFKQEIPFNWIRSASRVELVLKQLVPDQDLKSPLSCYNVNLPSIDAKAEEPERHITLPSMHPLPVAFEDISDSNHQCGRLFRYTGAYSHRDFEPGSDVECCFGGNISISKLEFLPANLRH